MKRDHVYSDKQLVISRTGLPRVLSIMGAIDYFNAAAVTKALEKELHDGLNGSAGTFNGENGDGRLRIDLSGLQFVDTSGLRAFFDVAEKASHRGGLVLHGLPPQLRRVIQLVGWGDLPGLVLDD
ncbi:MAG: hypothetical protein PVS3B2_09450 [Candidatus Dormibacteraceae bacterium]